MQTVIRRLWSLQNKNAAAPYWGDGGRGSTQFHRTQASGALDSADNGADRAVLFGWADVLSALGGKPLVRLNRSDGRSRGVLVTFAAVVALSLWQPTLWRASGDYSSRSTHYLFKCFIPAIIDQPGRKSRRVREAY